MKIKEFLGKNKAIILTVLITTVVYASVLGGFIGYGKYKQYLANKERNQKIQEQIAYAHKAGNKTPSQYTFGEKYEKAIKSEKPTILLFYADWCGYCIKFMPLLEQIANEYGEDITVTKINVEDEKYAKLVDSYSIGGFPTVYIIDPKYDAKILLSNSDLVQKDTFTREIDRYLKIREKLDM